MQSGQYFSLSFSGFDTSNTNVQGGVPDRIGDGNLSSGRSVTHWFDGSAFAIPGCPASTPVCAKPDNVGRFGNSGFNILAGRPIRNLDFGLLKDVKLAERVRLRFAMTVANALNHPNFTNPSANISSPGTLGVSSTQTRPLLSEPGPREIDFALRLSF